MTTTLKNPPLTDSPIITSQIKQEIETLFTIEREEIFEDGMESDFSKELFYAIQKYGGPVIEILAELMDYEGVNIEIVSEAMRWLGHIDHPPTYNKRLWLLERSLQHDSVRVRDGALLGLSSLDDPDAIPYIREAIETEKFEELREDMERTLLELENLERVY